MRTHTVVLLAILTLLVVFNVGMFFAGWRCSHAEALTFMKQFGVPQMVCEGWQ